MASAAVDSLTADLAVKSHIDAVNRDYVVVPRLGIVLRTSIQLDAP